MLLRKVRSCLTSLSLLIMHFQILCHSNTSLYFTVKVERSKHSFGKTARWAEYSSLILIGMGRKKQSLIWDCAPWHKNKSSRSIQDNVDIKIILSSIKTLLQPAEVRWMRSIKSEFRQIWTDRDLHRENDTYTVHGNLARLHLQPQSNGFQTFGVNSIHLKLATALMCVEL